MSDLNEMLVSFNADLISQCLEKEVPTLLKTALKGSESAVGELEDVVNTISEISLHISPYDA